MNKIIDITREVYNTFAKTMKKAKKTDLHTAIMSLEDQCLKLFSVVDDETLFSIIDNIIIEIIIQKNSNMILEHYFIVYKLKSEYRYDYGNGFFNKFFLDVYLNFPNAIISLFIELPNYQFFSYLGGYICNEILTSKNKTYKNKIYKLYNLIISLFTYQLNKDFNIIKSHKVTNETTPVISNAAAYAPSDKSNEFNNFICADNMKKSIIKKLIGQEITYEKASKEYNNIIEILSFNIVVFVKKSSKYTFENDIDLTKKNELCFKMFNKNFNKEVNKKISK